MPLVDPRHGSHVEPRVRVVRAPALGLALDVSRDGVELDGGESEEPGEDEPGRDADGDLAAFPVVEGPAIRAEDESEVSARGEVHGLLQRSEIAGEARLSTRARSSHGLRRR